MARGRLLDRAFFLNEEVSDLSIQERFLYIGLIVSSDDAGRFKATPKRLKAQIFPYDDNVTVSEVEKMLNRIASAKLISIYTDGQNIYAYHPNWEKWQPLRKDRLKPSDCPLPTNCQPVDNQMTTNCQPLPNLTQPNLTQPNKPRTRQKNAALWLEGFDEFWSIYPRKKNKGSAEKVWDKLRPSAELRQRINQSISQALKSDDWTKDKGKWIPHPATWLNAKGWEDDYTYTGSGKSSAAREFEKEVLGYDPN